MIDVVSVDCAFFGDHDHTPKILREHRCRWTEELAVQNKEAEMSGL